MSPMLPPPGVCRPTPVPPAPRVPTQVDIAEIEGVPDLGLEHDFNGGTERPKGRR